MLKKLREQDFDRYLDFAYQLALDMTKSGYPTYADGIKTKDDFVARAREAFSADNEEMLQDNKTVEQIVEDMNLFDDDLMSMVFDGNIEATGLLLRIILKRDDITIISVVGQRELQSPIADGRNVRLDILAKDNIGKHYNIEVQKNQRVRIYGEPDLTAV